MDGACGVTIAAQPKLFALPFDESKLGRNQRAVLERIDRYGWVSAREAGRIVYLQRRRLVKRRWRRDGKTSVWIRDPRRGRE